MSLGSNTKLTGVEYLSIGVGTKFESGSGSAISTNELWIEGTFTDAGTVEATFLESRSGTIAGGGRIVTQEAYLEGSLTTLREIRLAVWHFGRIGSTLVMSDGAVLENGGEFYADLDDTESGYAIQVATASTAAPKIVNTGEFVHNESGTTTVEVAFENLGQIIEYQGQFAFLGAITGEPSITWGGPENPSAENRPCPICGEPVVVATGDLVERQTDISIGGRGVGLDLTRTYNAQAAAVGLKGAFGYGWTSSFSDHLVLEGTSKKATLIQANGSTVPFTEGSGGSFIAPAWTQDTLSGSAEAGYTLTLANQTKHHFAGANGRLESVTDRNGNATNLSYGESGRLEAITDPASRRITLTYNSEGLIESAKDPMGHVVKYGYEGGSLASVTEPGETSPRWQFKYDGSHRLTTMTDGRGGKTTNEYDGSNRVVSQTDPAERRLSFEYKRFDTKITNHASGGSVTDERFTSNDEPYSITRGYGTSSATTETFAYDAAGNVTSVTDGDNHTTKYRYDSASNRTSMVDPVEHETKWTYDSTHDVETTTTAKGETTTIKRDVHGNAESISRPAPGGKTQTTKYKYDSHGDLESVTDPLERIWKYEYDAQGDRTSETDPEGDKRTWEYDADSRVTATVSPRGHAKGAKELSFTTKIERDEQGRPLTVTDPLKHVTKYTYDANGNLATRTDPNKHTTTYTYDADNEPIKVEEPNKTITETGYDGNGHVVSQIDGNKHETKYVRNPVGEVIEVIDPLGRRTTKEYDGAGNLKTLTDAAKRTTTYSYDAANRLKEVSYSDGKTHAITYEYDADGDRTSMIDGTGTTSYGYDQLDRLIESQDGHGDTSAYEYDLANEQIKITYPNGKSVIREYDNAGRLKSVTDWLEHTTKFAYDSDSDQTSTTFPAGTTNEDSYAFNDADQMSAVKMATGAETLVSLLYARDADGQVKTTTVKGLPGEEKPANTYDTNSRLTKAGTIAYKYDAANNPTILGTGSYTYDKADELETGPSVKYTYDEVGERTKTTPTSGPTTTYGYDQAGNLTSVTRSKEGETAAIEDSYAYDGNGLRASQTISEATSYFVWDPTKGLPLILSDGTYSYIYGPANTPVEQINNSAGTVTYLHHDQQGSTRLLTGSSGKAEATFTYDAYGNQTGHTGTATSALGYDGQYTNSDTGLIYLRARVYDPATAQALSVDPLASITWEPYSYVSDNPVNHSDPTGLCNEEPWTGSFWTEGNCLSGALGGPSGGGSQPLWWDIPAYGAVVLPCLAGAEALCAGGIAASGAAQAGGNGSSGSVERFSECPFAGTFAGLPPNWEPPTNAPQLPPTNVPRGWRVREMPSTDGYPNGYWRLEKPMPQGGWQGIDPSTGQPGSQPETHAPFPEGAGDF